MLLVAYVTTVLLLGTAYGLSDHRLQRLEIAAITLTLVTASSMLSELLVLNLDWVRIPDDAEKSVSRIIDMQILTPLVVLWASDLARGWKSRPARTVGYACAAALTFACDAFLVRHGALFADTRGWWGLAAKEALMPPIALGAIGLLRALIRKDGLPDATRAD